MKLQQKGLVRSAFSVSCQAFRAHQDHGASKSPHTASLQLHSSRLMPQALGPALALAQNHYGCGDYQPATLEHNAEPLKHQTCSCLQNTLLGRNL